MSMGDHQSSDVGPWGQQIAVSDRRLLLLFIFELAVQHAKRCQVRDAEEVSREIAMNAFRAAIATTSRSQQSLPIVQRRQ